MDDASAPVGGLAMTAARPVLVPFPSLFEVIIVDGTYSLVDDNYDFPLKA